MSVCGWKHGLHTDDPDWSGESWVDPKLKGKRRKRTINALLAIVTDDLRRAYSNGEFGYIICSRHPVSTFYSCRRLYASPARLFVRNWNRCYGNWLALAEQWPGRVLVVRHEDMIADFDNIMKEIKAKFGLKTKYNQFRNVKKRLHRWDDANWSQGSGPLTNQMFAARRSSLEFCLSKVGEKNLRILRSLIDRKIADQLQYTIPGS
jgi:hypothetical protein